MFVKIAIWLLMLAALGGCGSIIDFREYDYDTHRRAHIGIRGVDLDVHQARRGLWIEKSFRIGRIPATPCPISGTSPPEEKPPPKPKKRLCKKPVSQP